MSLEFKSGLLVIEREVDEIWKSLPVEERKKIVRYKGFDSRIKWPQRNFKNYSFEIIGELAEVKDFLGVENYYFELEQEAKNKVIDLILLESLDTKNQVISERFEFLGYDIGVLEEFGESTFFSIILNEVRVSGNDFLKHCEEKLNDFYLFSNLEDSKYCIQLRKKAFDSNRTFGIETAYSNEMLNIIKISLYR